MIKLTAFAAAALVAVAGAASAGDTLPMNPNKSTQVSPSLAGLIGTEVAAGTIVAAALVGTVIVITIVDGDGNTTTTTF